MGLGWQITDRTLIAATRESDLMMNGKKQIVYNQRTHSIAPLAQLDRASGYEPEGREFESLRAHHFTGVSATCILETIQPWYQFPTGGTFILGGCLRALRVRSTVSNRCSSGHLQRISVSLPEKPVSPSPRMFEGTLFRGVDQRPWAFPRGCI